MENENKTLKVCAVVCAIIGLFSLVIFIIPAVRDFIIDLIIAAKQDPSHDYWYLHDYWYKKILSFERIFFSIDFIALIAAYSDRVEKLKNIIFPKCMVLKKYVVIPDFKKWFGISFTLYFIGILAIIRANYLYADDLDRFLSGFKGWSAVFSRYLSNLFSTFLHCDNFLTDISPLTQIVAVVFLGIASVIAVVVLSGNRKASFAGIVAAIPIGLSPYFLQNLSYKYDAPYMSLSVLASIFPLLFVPQEKSELKTKQNLKNCIYNHIPYAVISIICILSICMLYQASLGIYPMLVLILALKRWNKKEPFAVFLLSSISAFIVTLAIFKLCFVKTVSLYVSTEIPNTQQLIPNAINNLLKYYSLVKSHYKEWWLNLHIVNLILFIAVCTIRSSRKKTIALATNIICSVVLACLVFGIYPALSKPLFAPRAMYGFGILCGFVSITIVCQTKSFLPKLPAFALAWIFFVFAFTYGNALSEQKRYTDFRIQQVISDLNDLDAFANKNIKNVQISGDIGKSPALRKWLENSKMLNRLIHSTFGGNEWHLNQVYFYRYFSLRNVQLIGDGYNNTVNLKELNLPVIKDTMYHTIKGDGTNFLIELK